MDSLLAWEGVGSLSLEAGKPAGGHRPAHRREIPALGRKPGLAGLQVLLGSSCPELLAVSVGLVSCQTEF